MNDRTLLLIEPDVGFALLVQACLEEYGWAVVHETVGREALALCQQRPFDAIMTEIELDDLDGFDLLAAIRASKSTERCIVCTHVPRARTWDRDVLNALGVSSLLVRPIRLEKIVCAIDPEHSGSVSGVSTPAAVAAAVP
jgi:DNA-binding response OmpR family regulator